MSISLIFLIISLICFVISALPITVRVNMVSIGLAFWVLAEIVGGVIH